MAYRKFIPHCSRERGVGKEGQHQKNTCPEHRSSEKSVDSVASKYKNMQNLTCIQLQIHTAKKTQVPQQPRIQNNHHEDVVQKYQSSSRLGRGEFRCARVCFSQQVHVHADTNAGNAPSCVE